MKISEKRIIKDADMRISETVNKIKEQKVRYDLDFYKNHGVTIILEYPENKINPQKTLPRLEELFEERNFYFSWKKSNGVYYIVVGTRKQNLDVPRL